MTKEQHSWVMVAEWQGRDTPHPPLSLLWQQPGPGDSPRSWADSTSQSKSGVILCRAQACRHRELLTACFGVFNLMRQYSSTPTGNLGRDDHSLSSSPGLMLGLQECTLSAYKKKLKENSISNTTKRVTPERGPWTTFHWSGRGFFLKSNKRDHI